MRLLVVGYGNELRCDDGVGPAAARAIAARLERAGITQVRTATYHQLLPELAAELAEVPCVLFMDAIAEPTETLGEPSAPRPIAPDLEGGSAAGHIASPAALLAMANHLYGHAAEGWLLAIPAADFSFADRPSAAGDRAIAIAVDLVLKFIHERLDGAPIRPPGPGS